MTARLDGLPFEHYVDLPEAHATALRDLLVSPLLYRWRQDHPREDKDGLRVGRACHTATLEPDRFLLEYTVWRGGIRRGAKWEAFGAANADKTILTEPQYRTALSVRDAVRSHPAAAALLKTGRPEVTLKWQHPRTGLDCKARIDWLSPAALVDLKTCRNPDPRKFAADAARLGYALQLALYGDAVTAVTGDAPPTKIVAAQNVPPFDVVVFDLGPEVLAVGHEQVEAALDQLVACSQSGVWPGIASEEVSLRLPAWATPEAEEESITTNGESLF